MQTGKTAIRPVVLLEPAGGDYWQHWIDVRAASTSSTASSPRRRTCRCSSARTTSRTRSPSSSASTRTTTPRATSASASCSACSARHRRDQLVALNDEFRDVVAAGRDRGDRASRPPKRETATARTSRASPCRPVHNFGRIRQLIDALNAMLIARRRSRNSAVPSSAVCCRCEVSAWTQATPLDRRTRPVRFRRGRSSAVGSRTTDPMAAEALVALGRGDAIASWSDWYAGRLARAPAGAQPDRTIELARSARRHQARRRLDRLLRTRAARAPVARRRSRSWVARLAPGIMAGATHGILRTAHAVRTLDGGENAPRVHELAEGLGYWAARYQELPSQRRRAAGRCACPMRWRECVASTHRVERPD